MTARVVVDDIPQLALTCAAAFESTAAEVLARRERFVIALPGGSVASAFCPQLAALAIDWTRTDIFWIDERAVPSDHTESNYALAWRLLLAPARVPPARIHRMPGELPDLAQAARRAADELRAVAGDPPHIDLVLAGVGEDGHVASLFPGGADVRPLASATARSAMPDIPVIPIYDAPKPPSRRLTLTLPVLASAGLLIVAAFGASKAAVMREALRTNGAATPIAELLRRARSPLVLLDREAGLSLAGSR
jgi:6-phosphogluconolactonase